MKNYKLKNNIRVQRAIKRVTQEEVASEIGVTRKTINTIENEVFIPSTLLAMRIAKYFDVSVEELFYIEITEE